LSVAAPKAPWVIAGGEAPGLANEYLSALKGPRNDRDPFRIALENGSSGGFALGY